MGSAFTWMRPNDLVWNYWVNNYLMGEDPPVFDILSWNADGTNLPAALHRQFLDIFEHNPLPTPGAMEALGTPIDLGTDQGAHLRRGRGQRPPDALEVDLPHHAAPLRGLHVRAEQRRTHRQPGQPARQPQGQLLHRPARQASSRPTSGSRVPRSTCGSWWEHWADWAVERSGERVAAPQELGVGSVPGPRPSAPGTYVPAGELTGDRRGQAVARRPARLRLPEDGVAARR